MIIDIFVRESSAHKRPLYKVYSAKSFSAECGLRQKLAVKSHYFVHPIFADTAQTVGLFRNL
jgi:hypothetical protein